MPLGTSFIARSETTTPPGIASAGQLAHHETTAVRRPAFAAMFHSAGTRRTVEETGTSPLGEGTTKSVMPCTAGGLPVAMLVQMTGEIA